MHHFWYALQKVITDRHNLVKVTFYLPSTWICSSVLIPETWKKESAVELYFPELLGQSQRCTLFGLIFFRNPLNRAFMQNLATIFESEKC